MKTTDIVLYALLAVIAAAIIVLFYRYNKDPALPSFNIVDLLMENGKLSRLAMAFDAAVVVTAWIMLKLVVDGKMTEGYLGIYGSFWVAPILAKMFATNNATATSTATSTTTVSIEATETK